MSEEQSDEAVRLFSLEITKGRAAYLKHIRAQGCKVSEEELVRLEKEIEAEELRSQEGSTRLLREQDVVSLQQHLAWVDLFADDGKDYLKALLLKRQYTKVKMRAEPNHGRAHFHIEYKKEFSASYAVDTLQKLAGYMPRKYEEPILKWAAVHRGSLVATWESLQAGEDVRELILVSDET